MRTLVTVDDSTKELPHTTKAAPGSVLESQIISISEKHQNPQEGVPNIIVVSSLDDVPAGTPTNTLVVVTS